MKKLIYAFLVGLLVFISMPSFSARAALVVGANSITTDGALGINGVANSAYTFGPQTTTGTIAIGGTAQTGNLVLGQSSAVNSILIGSGSGAATIALGSGSSSSKVGVGTASPSQPLHVVGNLLDVGHGAFGNTATIDSTNIPITLNVKEVLTSFPVSADAIYGIQNSFDFSNATAPTYTLGLVAINNDINIGSTQPQATAYTVLRAQNNYLHRDSNKTGDIFVADGVDSWVSMNGAGNASFVRGGYFFAEVGTPQASTTTMVVDNLIGVLANAWADDTATVNNVIGVKSQASNHNTAGPNVGNLIAVLADTDVPRHTDTSIGLQITSSNGNFATTAYGIKIDGVAGIDANNSWGIYENGSWKNYFGGSIGIGTTTPTEMLDINSDNIRIRTAKTPSSSSATCDQGEISWDVSFMYVCVATNTWKRTALTTW